MYTIINKNKSELFKITHGIPQGSVLGTLLLLLYFNELPLTSKFKFTLFADDANLYISHQNLKTLQLVVNNEIEKVDCWMSMNKLTSNYSKCKCIITSKRFINRALFTIKINNLNFDRAHYT